MQGRRLFNSTGKWMPFRYRGCCRTCDRCRVTSCRATTRPEMRPGGYWGGVKYLAYCTRSLLHLECNTMLAGICPRLGWIPLKVVPQLPGDPPCQRIALPSPISKEGSERGFCELPGGVSGLVTRVSLFAAHPPCSADLPPRNS